MSGFHIFEDKGIYVDGDNGFDASVHFMAFATAKHETIISSVSGQFWDNFRRGGSCRVFGSNTGLFIGARFDMFEHFESVQKKFQEQIEANTQHKLSIAPDLQVICDFKPTDFSYLGYHGTPKMVFEVWSKPTWKDDIGWKKDIYETLGIPEYWNILNVENVDVYTLIEGAYQKTSYSLQAGEDILKIPVGMFPGLTIELDRRDIVVFDMK